MKSYIWIGGIIVILIAIMFWAVSGSGINPPFELGAVHPLDHVKGNASSTVIIVEYSDFQCPACRTYYSMTKELTAEFGDKIAFVYRHFPLIEIHSNAMLAAQAAEAAGKQGKFWEMHNLLFEKQSEWADTSDVRPLFESYAILLGISVDQFKTDWASSEVKNFVRAQRTHAIKSGMQGTPTFFVNGEQIENPATADAFRIIIREAINKAGQ